MTTRNDIDKVIIDTQNVLDFLKNLKPEKLVEPEKPEEPDQALYDLLNLIGEAEANGNYNAHWPNSVKTNPPFTQMTINEVQDWQQERIDDGAYSVAVGRYQIISKTLNRLVKNLDKRTLFNKNLQDKLAIQLLNGRGLQRFIAGSIKLEHFCNNLAKEWAGLPCVSGPKKGRSYYDGDGVNSAQISVDELLNTVAKLAV